MSVLNSEEKSSVPLERNGLEMKTKMQNIRNKFEQMMQEKNNKKNILTVKQIEGTASVETTPAEIKESIKDMNSN